MDGLACVRGCVHACVCVFVCVFVYVCVYYSSTDTPTALTCCVLRDNKIVIIHL